MNRRYLLTRLGAGAVAAVLGATPALARDDTGAVVDQLHRLGYQKVTVSRTILGRVRITAERDRVQREIVLDPRSGEILRDLSTRSGRPAPLIRDNDDGKPARGSSGSGGGGDSSGSGNSGRGSSDDSDDDDSDDDDNDNDDNDDDKDNDDDDHGDDGKDDDD